MNGESLHIAGRLLGHRRASTTNRYVHLDAATLSQAAEWVAMAVERKLRAAAEPPTERSWPDNSDSSSSAKYQLGKDELEEDMSIDATPEELARSVLRQVNV